MEILLRYRRLVVKGDVFIGERGIFGAEIFLRYRQFFVKSDFIIGRVECMADVSLMTVMPFSCGMLVYKLFTSKVHKRAPVGSCSTSFKMFIR